MAKTANQLASDARKRVENLGAEEVQLELAYGATLVDVREQVELAAEGMIPGAIHVPRGMIEFAADPTSPHHHSALRPDERIILYCAGGARSALAAATLMEMGYRKVGHLEPGFRWWKEAGYPVRP